MKLEYHVLEISGIVIFLGSGAFLLLDSLNQPGQTIEVIGGSVLLVLGGIVAAALARAWFRQIEHGPTHE